MDIPKRLNQKIKKMQSVTSDLAEAEQLFLKWKKTGLLDSENLSIFEKVELAKRLEQGAKFLVEKSKTNSEMNEDIAGVFLPLIRRTFNSKDKFNISELYNLVENNIYKLKENQKRLKELFPNMYEKYLYDIEPAFCDELEQIYKISM